MKEYLKRRKKLISKMPKNSLAIIFGSNSLIRNGDVEFPFRQNSDFFYLTGFKEPNAVAIIESEDSGEFTIFCQDKDPSKEQWEGKRMGPKNCKKIGAKKGFSIEEFSEKISDFLINKERVYYQRDLNNVLEDIVDINIASLKKTTARSNNFVPKEVHSLDSLLHEIRLLKTKEEIKIIKKACEISSAAHIRAMKNVCPKMYEYQLEAEYIHEFMKNGAKACAYPSIVGGGKNACILHYNENSDQLLDGDLVLVDAGCEFKGYASDITRTFPVSGKFTPRQKDVYNAVLRVMKAAKKLLVPGTLLNEYHLEVGKLMEKELIDLGLITHQDVANQNPELPAYKKYFMHGTSHYLGLDVHDVGSWTAPIEAGMVFTCEPGIYIPDENLGIRLENDILVTENGPIDLMANIPLEAEDIEALMA